MKYQKKASILIWTLFLMMFVVSSFFYMSLKLKTKMQTEKKNQIVVDSTTSQKYFTNSFTGIVAQGGKLEFSFSSNNTGTLFLSTGGTLEYSTGSSSGIMYGNIPYELGFVSGDILSLKGISGMTEFRINFSQVSGVNFPYNYNKKFKEIGGQKIQESFGILKN